MDVRLLGLYGEGVALLSDGGSVSGASWVSGALDAARAVSAPADMATEIA